MSSFRRFAPALALPLLALAFLVIVALSSWGLRGWRLDLTEHGLYTLSPGTQRILDRIDEPVRLKLYYSEHAARDLPQFRVFAQRVTELLQEVAARSHGKVTLEIVDPEPFSDAEDQAAGFGLQAVPINTAGDSLYFGLVGSNSTDGETTMPFIQPDKESFLEYDVAKLISTLTEVRKPVVAMLSGLPTGPGMDPVTGQPTLGWVVDRQVAELFELRRLQPEPTSIGDDVDLLLLIHPKNLPDATLAAIDQFVLRGGRLLAFVDPDAESDAAGGNLLDPVAMAEGRASDLPALFKAWGIQYDPTRVVLDSRHALQVQPDPNAPPLRHYAVLGLHKDSLNQNDVVSADLESLNLSSAGTFSLAAGSPLKAEPLVQSSSSAALADAEAVRSANNDPRALSDGFKPDAKAPYLIAARLTGMLPSAFPDDKTPGHLARSKQPAHIILVADTDLLADRLWVQMSNFLGQQVFNPFAQNGDFVYNAVDNLVGTGDLIAVRTRATASRPFERFEAIQRAAEQQFRTEEKRLQEQLSGLEEKLQQLQPSEPGAAAPALTREQQAQLAEYQRQKLAARRALRDVQHQLNADIERLQFLLKVINIGLVPYVLILVALAVAFWRMLRRHRQAAQPLSGWDITLSLLLGTAVFFGLGLLLFWPKLASLHTSKAIAFVAGFAPPLIVLFRLARRAGAAHA
jgi:ABC-type uncharacterized transport system involved in gliding motility auxiliary subunit